jgi:uncharacterized protein (UPF0262 family)
MVAGGISGGMRASHHAQLELVGRLRRLSLEQKHVRVIMQVHKDHRPHLARHALSLVALRDVLRSVDIA